MERSGESIVEEDELYEVLMGLRNTLLKLGFVELDSDHRRIMLVYEYIVEYGSLKEAYEYQGEQLGVDKFRLDDGEARIW